MYFPLKWVMTASHFSVDSILVGGEAWLGRGDNTQDPHSPPPHYSGSPPTPAPGPVPCEADPTAGPVGVPQDAGGDHLPEGLQQRLQLLLVHPQRQVGDVEVGGVLLLLLRWGTRGGGQGVARDRDDPKMGWAVGRGAPGPRTLAICACTPLALSAVTAFWAAVGLSKSTKP